MDATLDHTPEATEGAGAHVPAPGSPLDLLRKGRENLLQEHRLYLEVPGYTNYGGLWLELRTLDYDENNAIGKRLEKDKRITKDRQLLVGAMDTLIMATTRVLTVDPSLTDDERDGTRFDLGDGLVPIDPEAPESDPVRFDKRLARILGFDSTLSNDPNGPGIARQVVVGTFTKNGEMNILGLAREHGRWCQDVTKNVDEGLQGES